MNAISSPRWVTVPLKSIESQISMESIKQWLKVKSRKESKKQWDFWRFGATSLLSVERPKVVLLYPHAMDRMWHKDIVIKAQLFSFSFTGWLTKTKESSVPYYLPIAARNWWIRAFIEVKHKQPRVAKSITYDDDRYVKVYWTCVQTLYFMDTKQRLFYGYETEVTLQIQNRGFFMDTKQVSLWIRNRGYLSPSYEPATSFSPAIFTKNYRGEWSSVLTACEETTQNSNVFFSFPMNSIFIMEKKH